MPPAANSTASSVNLSAEPASYPQISQTRPFFKENEPATLEPAKGWPRTSGTHLATDIAAIRVGAARPLQTKFEALLPARNCGCTNRRIEEISKFQT